MQRQRNLADLVQEQRAPVGQLEQPALLRPRVGEGAFLIAEQLALQQRLRDGRAIDGDERFSLPGALVMQGLSHQVLARPVLAFQQNRGRLAAGHLAHEAQHLLHGGRIGDHLPLHRRQLFGDVLDGGRHAFHFPAVVEYRRGPNQHHPLAPLPGVQVHHPMRQGGRGMQTLHQAATGFALPAVECLAAAQTHHLRRLDYEQFLRRPVHPGDLLFVVVQHQGVGKLVEDRLQNVGLLPLRDQFGHISVFSDRAISIIPQRVGEITQSAIPHSHCLHPPRPTPGWVTLRNPVQPGCPTPSKHAPAPDPGTYPMRIEGDTISVRPHRVWLFDCYIYAG